MREFAGAMPEVGEALLQMQRHGVIDLGPHARGRQMLTQQVAVACPDHVLIVDVTAARRDERRPHGPPQISSLESAVVEGCVALPARSPGIEMLELDVENRRLQLIQTEISADQGMEVFRLAA